MRLDGKVALISGTAGGVKGKMMGIGGASAWLFFREGAAVVLGGINDESGEKTASQIREDGGNALFVHLDVTSAKDWAAAVRTTASRFGGLDVLVNCAGTGSRHTVEETTEEMWDEQMNVHAKGVFLGTKHAIPEMLKRGGGSIVNISSIYGITGSPGSTAYHAAKGAVRLFTKTGAVQYGKHNIRINSVLPGYTSTPMTSDGFEEPGRHQWLLDRTPMGRFAEPEEIAYGILYLASDESSYVTGSDLVIDGGVTAQ